MIKPFYFSWYCLILFLISSCSDPDAIPEGVKIVHFPGTDIVQQSISYHNGKKNGPFKEFYKNGTLKAKQFFVNDSLNDTSSLYLPDGKLQSIHIYKNKQKDGCWKDYNKEGRLFSEIYMKKGLLDSTSTIYTYRSGRVLTRVTYKAGAKNGKEEHFYSNGKPRSIAWYDMGRVCMGTEEWNETGKKINNDFKISIAERNEVMMKNMLSYVISLENPQPKDKVFQVMTPIDGKNMGAVMELKKVNGNFLIEFNVGPGGFVMDKITLAAYRKTAMGNTFIKTTTFNVSSNNF